MSDIPNVLFINLVDTRAQIDYNQHGVATVPINQVQTSMPLEVSKYRRISVMIGNCNAKSARMYIGKISGPTLAEAYEIPLDYNVHTFEVIGPQMRLLLLGGPPNMSEKVKIWVYLKS